MKKLDTHSGNLLATIELLPNDGVIRNEVGKNLRVNGYFMSRHSKLPVPWHRRIELAFLLELNSQENVIAVRPRPHILAILFGRRTVRFLPDLLVKRIETIEFIRVVMEGETIPPSDDQLDQFLADFYSSLDPIEPGDAPYHYVRWVLKNPARRRRLSPFQ